jgi:hypothetical protein
MAFVQAGTAISERNKGETNSFNVIRTGSAESHEKQIIVDRYSWTKTNINSNVRIRKSIDSANGAGLNFTFPRPPSIPIRR